MSKMTVPSSVITKLIFCKIKASQIYNTVSFSSNNRYFICCYSVDSENII